MQGLSSSYNAHLSHGGPPVLPMYKSLVRKRAPQQTMFTTIPIIFFLCGFLAFFFCSIYIGANYLHDHLQDEKWGNKIGLPGTRNIIQKWSIAHLHGIDLTALGPPIGRKESSLASKISPPFKFLFNSAFGSKAIVESMELEKQMAPVEPNGLNAEPLPAVPVDGVQAVLQGAEIAGNADGVNLVSVSEDKEAEVKVEEEEEEEEEEEHMDGDSKDLFSKEENDEKDESKEK